MIIVLDTNVFISGIINPAGPPGHIIDLLRTGEIITAVDDRILNEYIDVLNRPRLAKYFSPGDVKQIVEYLAHNSEIVIPTFTICGLPDPHDAPFAETALTLSVPLVTGNTRHFETHKSRTLIVETPAEFITRFE